MSTTNASLFYVVSFVVTVDFGFIQSRQSIGQRVQYHDIRQQSFTDRGHCPRHIVRHRQTD